MTVVPGGSESATDVEQRLHQFLTRSGLAAQARTVPLTGDASDRHYFRLIVPSEPPRIVAVHNGPFEYESLPFVNVAGLLRRMSVPVPDILSHADDLGILVLQDLGDVTLQAQLGLGSSEGRRAWYEEAVDLIGTLQRDGRRLASAPYRPFGQAFDREKLQWELDFFVRHFIEGYRGLVLGGTVRAALDVEWARVVDELAAEPRVLCHRDYHSRNLMVRDDRLYVIDFQDARMGPDTYDLVSLLRDSYVDLPDGLVDDAIRRFLTGCDTAYTPDVFRARFDLAALQRNLKALGTFGYQTTVRRNPVYLQYIPRTLRYVRENLSTYPRFDRLHETLSQLIEELR